MKKFLVGLAAHAATAVVTFAAAIWWLQCGAANLSVHRVELSDGKSNFVRLLPDMVSVDNANGSLFLLANDPPNWKDGPALVGMSTSGPAFDRQVFIRVCGKGPSKVMKETSFDLATRDH